MFHLINDRSVITSRDRISAVLYRKIISFIYSLGHATSHNHKTWSTIRRKSQTCLSELAES